MESIISMLSETAVDVFKKMVYLDVAYIKSDGPVSESIENVHMHSMVILDGALKGSIVFHCTEKLAKQVTCGLLGEDMANDPVDMDVKDAIGEITNIIAGNMKNRISSIGHNFTLSTPKVISWNDYLNELRQQHRKQVLKFNSGEEIFFIELLSTNGALG